MTLDIALTLLIILGATADPDGNLLTVPDIPRIVMVQFRTGYAVSRAQISTSTPDSSCTADSVVQSLRPFLDGTDSAS